MNNDGVYPVRWALMRHFVFKSAPPLRFPKADGRPAPLHLPIREWARCAHRGSAAGVR